MRIDIQSHNKQWINNNRLGIQSDNKQWSSNKRGNYRLRRDSYSHWGVVIVESVGAGVCGGAILGLWFLVYIFGLILALQSPCPGSGVVLDCFDSWSLHFSFLWCGWAGFGCLNLFNAQLSWAWNFKCSQKLKWCFLRSKYGCKDQESIQSSTTLDPGYQWESDKLPVIHHKRGPILYFV